MNPVEAMLGLAKWLTASAAPDTIAEQRAATCVTCASMVEMRIKGTPLVAGFCGKPITPTDTTCGCLVLWGETTRPTRPAGKTKCASEYCPQGKWSATDDTTSDS